MLAEERNSAEPVVLLPDAAVPLDGDWVGVATGAFVAAGEGDGLAEGFGVDMDEAAAEGTGVAEGAGEALGAAFGFSDGRPAITTAGVGAGASEGLAIPKPNNRPVNNRDANEAMAVIATKKTRIIPAYFHLFFTFP